MAKRAVEKMGSAATPEYGLHMIVPGSALIAQADDRIRWHEQNAARDDKEAADLKAQVARDSDAWQHRSRINDLERRADSHREYARFLTFIKRHLVAKRRYRLNLVDMSTLEIMPKGLYV